MAYQWNCYGVVAKDMKKSVDFYRQLGFDLPDAGDDHIEATLPNGMRFMLDSLELIESLMHWVEPVGHRSGIGIQFDTPGEVDAKYADLVSQGYTGYKAPFDAFWGQRYAQIEDPDGNLVDLFAAL